MHIGILKTDTVRPEWVGEFGEYPDMFERLLSEAEDGLRFSVWDVEGGVLPDNADIESVCGLSSPVARVRFTMTSGGFVTSRC